MLVSLRLLSLTPSPGKVYCVRSLWIKSCRRSSKKPLGSLGCAPSGDNEQLRAPRPCLPVRKQPGPITTASLPSPREPQPPAPSPRGSALPRCHREMGSAPRRLRRAPKGPASFWPPPPRRPRGAALGAGSLMGDARGAEEAAARERERERDWAREAGGGGQGEAPPPPAPFRWGAAAAAGAEQEPRSRRRRRGMWPALAPNRAAF